MKNSNKSKKLISISVIGARAYPSDFVGTSGLEIYVENIVKELSRIRRDLKFIIYTKATYQERRFVKSKAIRVRKLVTIHSKVLESVIYSLIASFFSAFDRSAIVWYHGVGPSIFSFIPRLLGKRIVLTVHSLDWERKKWSPTEKFFFEKGANFAFLLRPKIFAVSLSLKAYILKNFGVSATYVPPGIELQKVKSPEFYLKKFGLFHKSYLLFLGRFVPEKRLEWLIEAFLELKTKFKGLRLVLAGGHGNIPNYEKGLRERYKGGGITWMGYVFGKEKLSLLSHCRCFVLPSELEGNPVSLAEALGVGALCLVSEDVAEEFPKLGNILEFKTQSKNSFSNALGKALVQKSKKGIYKKKELEGIKGFSWKKTAGIYFREFNPPLLSG